MFGLNVLSTRFPPYLLFSCRSQTSPFSVGGLRLVPPSLRLPPAFYLFNYPRRSKRTRFVSVFFSLSTTDYLDNGFSPSPSPFAGPHPSRARPFPRVVSLIKRFFSNPPRSFFISQKVNDPPRFQRLPLPMSSRLLRFPKYSSPPSNCHLSAISCPFSNLCVS